jgi:hypothetical protein
MSDTSRLQYYDVQTLEYRYISKLPMKNERIWSYVKETTSDNMSSVSQNVLKFYQQLTGEERRVPFIFGRNNQ